MNLIELDSRCWSAGRMAKALIGIYKDRDGKITSPAYVDNLQRALYRHTNRCDRCRKLKEKVEQKLYELDEKGDLQYNPLSGPWDEDETFWDKVEKEVDKIKN